MTSNDVVRALMTMGKLYGKDLSEDAAQMLLEDLERFAPETIVDALRSCRKELSRFPTVHEIISRVEAKDGRPGPEEAWAMIPKSEDGSVIWTDEMSGAYGIAASLLKSGDEVGARMAFKEKYTALVREARDANESVRWTMSPGYDPAGRETAIREALRLGRLESTHALAMGLIEAPKGDTLYLSGNSETTNAEEAKARIREMIKSIGKQAAE